MTPQAAPRKRPRGRGGHPVLQPGTSLLPTAEVSVSCQQECCQCRGLLPSCLPPLSAPSLWETAEPKSSTLQLKGGGENTQTHKAELLFHTFYKMSTASLFMRAEPELHEHLGAEVTTITEIRDKFNLRPKSTVANITFTS